MFQFKGALSLSKSWLNRALIIQSYDQSGFDESYLDSDAEDVQDLKKALQQLRGGQTFFDLGQGGTTFRFFSFLVSRRPGVWTLNAHPRLFERPQKDLQMILKQLGVDSEFKDKSFVITSNGWSLAKTLQVEAQESSQFLSGLLLNSWNLEQNLKIQIQKPIVSEDYLKLTLAVLEKKGLDFKITDSEKFRLIEVAPLQKVKKVGLVPELDVSSAFALAAAAVIDGDVEITNWNASSTQPDAIFLKLFDQMQISYVENKNSLSIKRQTNWKGIEVNLNRCPDLFPVLAVLCSLATGPSRLYGAEQLKHKESDRILKTKQLLDSVGLKSDLLNDGLLIYGRSEHPHQIKDIIFDPDFDHRMAMAAGLLKKAGFPIQILNPEVVKKSYSRFWENVGLSV